MSQRHKFFSHKDCEFFPCHPGADRENFNCLFCFCPLYALGENCGGSYSLLPNGVKDCSRCLYPHEKEHYDAIMAKLKK